eukprot:COSAG04_NODE_2485_length_4031_cov_206.589522_1_plen_280_part_00
MPPLALRLPLRLLLLLLLLMMALPPSALSSEWTPPSGWTPPRPTPRQLDFMQLELAQFMHFGPNTFWDPPSDYLHGPNPTYHNCYSTAIDHGPQTGEHWPCLSPDVFAPTDLDCDEWMLAAKAMGTKEICLTAAHEGGFALWPSNYTNYSVAASKWRDGKGDVLREFADAANRHGIKICYYLQVADDGWGMRHRVPNYTASTFLEASLGKLREVLTEYGPVNRFCTPLHPHMLTCLGAFPLPPCGNVCCGQGLMATVSRRACRPSSARTTHSSGSRCSS